MSHFNHKAKARYMFNYFRRLIGINSLPMHYADQDGKKSDKFLSAIISLFLNENPHYFKDKTFEIDIKFVDKLSKILVLGIESPHKFENEIKQFINAYHSGSSGEKLIEESELLEIANRLKTSFTDEERKKLKHLAKQVKKIVRKLSSRQFLQLMAGSACKAQENEKKLRSFNIYKIHSQEDGYLIRCEKYGWDSQANGYDDKPHITEYNFHDKNRPLH